MALWHVNISDLSTLNVDLEDLLAISDGLACQERFKNNSDTGLSCNSTWDSIYCWPSIPAGHTIFLPCPQHKGFDSSKILAHRTCDEDGEWHMGNWTNYTACLQYPIKPDAAILLAVRDIYVVGSSLSLLTLCVTLFIFCYFRRLQCDRIRIHKHFVLSLILRAIILIVLLQPFLDISGSYEYMNEPVVCRGLVVLLQYFSLTNIFWMLIEGLFLYVRCVVAVMRHISSLTVFYVIGWGAPVMFVVAWTIVMTLYDTESCWHHYGRLPYVWIVSGPIVAALLVNLYFLFHILAVLVTKIKDDQKTTHATEPWYELTLGFKLDMKDAASNMAAAAVPKKPGELERIRKALRALFVLLPLLGLTNLLFFVDPQDDGVGQHIFQIFNALLQSTQGLVVSIIYCFTNDEVRSVIRDRMNRQKPPLVNKTVLSANGYHRRSAPSTTCTTSRDPDVRIQRSESVV
ncbi:corticotropin-releasing factor receptor 1-like [Branchiostoma lanceolatum]|uniref:corticotropin-releasing factor receptor 1-like n=1 Tax=Branchiostoma lanceolatum TaxID=7740 RepID=UPI003451CFAA